MPSDILIVLTNCPDEAAADRLAQSLVIRRLAACVNILAPCRSYYRWEGKIEAASEVPLLIKTHAARYAELAEAIVELHPYELPEIVAVGVEHGLAKYLEWVTTQTEGAPLRKP